MATTVGPIAIECIAGDISRQSDVDAVVNAANAQLMPGSGVAGALHRAAGPGLAEECAPLAPIAPGQAVITSAHRLPNRYVIHVLGPRWGIDEPSEQFLTKCYQNALRLGEQHAIESIAFPAISTGAFGYPFELAMRVALATVIRQAVSLHSLKLVRFVLSDSPAAQTCSNLLTEIFGAGRAD